MAEELKETLMMNPKFVELAISVMKMDISDDVNLEYLREEFEEDLIKVREGGYGKEIQYVAAKHYRDKLNDVFNHKWSFFPITSEVIDEPQFRRYNKDDNEYEWLDGSPYVKVLGCLIIPGLGIQMQYGVKKVQGDTESDAIKAATTDALKKCCEQIGMSVPYDEEDNYDGSNNSSGGGKSERVDIDIDDVEFTDEELEEALEVEIGFGKFKGQTLEDIVEDEPEYLEWLYQKANEQEVAEAAAIVYKNYLDEEEAKKAKKKSRRSGRQGSGAKSERTSKSSKRTSSKETKSTKSTKSTSASAKKKEKVSPEDEEERQELLDTITEIFEEDENYDEVTIQSMVAGVSISKKYPQGKTELEQLTLSELNKLSEALVDDFEDEDE